ncbi:oxidoreductase [Bacillus sp. JCM 19046]|nr:oxidoreductase [Bacillus sp. JCM 19045]GAF18366.1 oxidoreductase [Bacillus sp. JCM 19046]
MEQKQALIIGASGLVGSHLIRELLSNDQYAQVTALVRKPLGLTHPKLQEHIIDFDRLEEEYPDVHADDVFCCLGTTIKKAKTKKKMYTIDVEYPYTVARLARARGMQHLLLVSSVGANPHSRFFYSRIKGELEDKLIALNLPSLSIFRPSLLVGDRAEFRFGEKLATRFYQAVSPVLPTSLKATIGIEASTVAKAMVRVSSIKPNRFVLFDAADMVKLR